MRKDSAILVTGSSGMVGRTLLDKLHSNGYSNLLTPQSSELDLTDQLAVKLYFERHKVDYVFHLAAKVGGIAANIRNPARYLQDNLLMQCNVIDQARLKKVRKLLFLGSSCIYPYECPQPMKEEYLMTGPLEPTNEGYALAKVAGLKLCQFYNKQYGTNFISLMPPNMYGPYDHFDDQDSHVVSALMSKFHKAKKDVAAEVVVWGSGSARREFLYTDDCADAMIYFMEKYDAAEIGPFINIGLGDDISIKDLAVMIKGIVGFKGKIVHDLSKPEGMKRKMLDSTRAAKLGWKAKISMKEGLIKTYEAYKATRDTSNTHIE
jgi:GDP-L-fucose synthase